MNRFLMRELVSWKNRTNRKPLILQGARQVGKTWLLMEFGKQHFDNIAYVGLEDNSAMETLFEGSLAPTRLIEGLQAYIEEPITTETLIILDEVQAVPRALTALKILQ